MRDVSPNIKADPTADVVGILDELSDLLTTKALPGPRCSVRNALERVAAASPEVAEAVRQRVEDPQLPAKGVAGILANRTGIEVSSFTVRRHRKRGTPDGCRCPR